MRLRVRYRISWLMVAIVKLSCLGLITAAKLCKKVTLQMWYTNRLQQFYESLTRTKKFFIFGTIFLIVLLFLWPSWLPLSKSSSSKLLSPHRWLAATERPLGPSEYCLEAKLEQFSHGVETFDVIVNHLPLLSLEKHYLPYVGNGYIGTSVAVSSQLHIKSDRILSFPINFYPIVDVVVEGVLPAKAFAIHLLNGVVYHISTFHLKEERCIVVTCITYADRHRPSVLVQEIRVHNPTDHPVAVDIRQIGVSAWSPVKSYLNRINTARTGDVDYNVIEGKVPASRPSHTYLIAIANVKLPETVTVKPTTTWSTNAVTVVRYELVKSTYSNNQSDIHIQKLSQLAQQELADVLNIESKVLRNEHTQIWNTLWNSGFGISLSFASGALNGDKINATMYYVLSQTRSLIFEIACPQEEKTKLEKLLYYPDRCYTEHHTLQNYKMWRDFSRLEDIFDSSSTWLVTLEKNGCDQMIKAGADGVLQAMILSYGAFKFNNHHLEFGTHPRDLHRDYFYRRINYGNNTHVNVSVLVGDDNKAVLFVSLDRFARPYYACDAGCVDSPQELGRDLLKLPVKLTDPITPILYITDNKKHMEELKLAIHVKEIVEAPAQEQNVMVLHKHGHHFGNLPKLFWASISILIFVFHMFLFKLIYNEYCNSTTTDQMTTSRRNHHSTGRYMI